MCACVWVSHQQNNTDKVANIVEVVIDKKNLNLNSLLANFNRGNRNIRDVGATLNVGSSLEVNNNDNIIQGLIKNIGDSISSLVKN